MPALANASFGKNRWISALENFYLEGISKVVNVNIGKFSITSFVKWWISALADFNIGKNETDKIQPG